MRSRHLLLSSMVAAFTVGCANAQAPATVGTAASRAQAERMRAQLETASEGRDTVALKRVMGELETASVVSPRDPWLLHYRGYAVYSLASMRMDGNAPARVLPDLLLADSLLEQSLSTLALPEGIALRASIAGMRAGADPESAMTQGMKSGMLMSQALSMGPRNPRVLVLAGASALYTPEQWGGGKARARELLQRAQEAFATDTPESPAPRWGRSMLTYFLSELSSAR